MEKLSYCLDAQKLGRQVSDNLYGQFFEDANGSADGGLNAEMIINNSFEWEQINYNGRNGPQSIKTENLKYWKFSDDSVVRICCDSGCLKKNNPSYLSIQYINRFRLTNCGYAFSEDDCGMAFTKNEKYNFSMYFSVENFKGEIKVWLDDGAPISEVITLEYKKFVGWQKLKGIVTANKTKLGKLCVEFVGSGYVAVDYLSLLPQKVWGDGSKWRFGRISTKVVEALKQANPKFLRFPGGCVVEGDVDFHNMYMWKETLGSLINRRQKANLWNGFQSYGIGFYEYFLLCEDLNANPLPILPCGMLCQVRTSSRKEGFKRIKPDDIRFKEMVTDNLAHLIYFALGRINSSDKEEKYWANYRKKMGHPEPFKLKYIGLGNENWGEEYFENVGACLKQLSEYNYKGKPTDILNKFRITIVTSCGVGINPPDNNDSWKIINDKYADTIADEHFYNTYQWFIDNAYRYDGYDRSGAKVIVGEYGTKEIKGCKESAGENSMGAALAEAAFLTGLERNSDVVKMSCHASLLAKASNKRITPNLISYNNIDIMRTPSYYTQSLYANFVGKHTLEDGAVVSRANGGGLFIGACGTSVAFRSIHVKNRAEKIIYSHNFSNGLDGWKLYPDSEGGTMSHGWLILEATEKLNGYYLEGNFSDCIVEVKAKKRYGKEGYIVGVGVEGVEKTENENDNYSLWCHYGALGNKVSFEKRFKYMRTAFETFDTFKGYNPRGNILKLDYGEKVLSAEIFDGKSYFPIMQKAVWKVNEKVLRSATIDKKNIYYKLVNISEESFDVEVLVSNFNCGKQAKVITLRGEDIGDVNTIGDMEGAEIKVQPKVRKTDIVANKILFTIPAYSLTVLVI